MAVLNFLQLRLDLYAVLRAVFATAGEGASWRQIQRTRNFTLERLNFFARLEVYLEDCAHESLGIRMFAGFCNAAVLQPFYYITQIHYGNLVTHKVNKAEIMGNEQISDIFFFLNAA